MLGRSGGGGGRGVVKGRDKTGAFTLCFSASQNTKTVLQMVLRTENAPNAARSNLDWMQSMVSVPEVLPQTVVAIHSCLPGLQAPKSGRSYQRAKRGLSWD